MNLSGFWEDDRSIADIVKETELAIMKAQNMGQTIYVPFVDVVLA